MTAALTIGADVGGTSTRVGLVDADGDVVDLVTSATPRGADPVIAHLTSEIRAASTRAGGSAVAVGIGIPGRVDPHTRVLSMAVNLGIGGTVPLGDLVEAAVDLPVALGNDVDLAAVGAHRDACARGTTTAAASLAYVSIGTGFAVGLVLGGELHRGVRGAGEIGHLPMPGGDRPCPCGQIGCVETVASGAAMMRAWGREGSDVFELWDAADGAGDPVASGVREQAIEAIGWAVQCTTLLFDPDIVVLGGGVSALGARLGDAVADELAERGTRSPFVASYAIGQRLHVAPADAQFGVIGAAAWARRCIGLSTDHDIGGAP
jgi:glucokinase